VPVAGSELLAQLSRELTPEVVARVYASSKQELMQRDRVLPLPTVLLLLLHFVVLRVPSFLALLDRWAEGSLPGLRPGKVSRQAWSQRLQALPHRLFLSVLRDVTLSLRTQTGSRPWVAALAPFATAIVGVDDTTLDALARKVEWLWCFASGAPQTLAGRLGTMFDLTTGLITEVVYDADSRTNERLHLAPMLDRLAAGTLLLFDLGYFSFALFDRLTDLSLWYVSRCKARTRYEVVQVLCDRPLYRDRLVWLGTDHKDRAAHPARLVELCLEGVWWRYLTNVLDPAQLPADKLWALYAERWGVETSFAAIKQALGLASLRTVHANTVLIQVWTTLLLYHVLQSLRLQLAAACGWKADEVSWLNLMRRIASYAELRHQHALPTLSQWLEQRAKLPGLQKRGTRVRRRRQLPDEVQACLLPVPPTPQVPVARSARASSAARFARPTARLPVLTLAELTPGTLLSTQEMA